MLMNVSKEHRLQSPMGTQQLLKTNLIEEPDRIHAGISDGDRWMMKSDHQGQITALRTLQALRQPTKLKRTELASSRTHPMAAQQQHSRALHKQISGSCCPRPSPVSYTHLTLPTILLV